MCFINFDHLFYSHASSVDIEQMASMQLSSSEKMIEKDQVLMNSQALT